MKVNIIDDNNIIVFLNIFNIKNIDFDSKENIENHFRNIFLKLKLLYNINIKGYYNINIYMNKKYGAFLEIEHEDIEYFEYFDNKVDMRINVISDVIFLYKINDIFMLDKNILRKIDIYFFKDSFYLYLNSNLDVYKMGELFELGNLIYGNECNEVVKLGQKISLN